MLMLQLRLVTVLVSVWQLRWLGCAPGVSCSSVLLVRPVAARDLPKRVGGRLDELLERDGTLERLQVLPLCLTKCWRTRHLRMNGMATCRESDWNIDQQG